MTAMRKTFEEVPYDPSKPELVEAGNPLRERSLEQLLDDRDALKQEMNERGQAKGRIEAELERRIIEAHPDFDEAASGGRTIAGSVVLLSMTWSKTWAYSEEVVGELMASGLLTQDELNKLIPKWEPKVDGRALNTLAKRGGALGELLGRLRFLQRATPTFEAKARL